MVYAKKTLSLDPEFRIFPNLIDIEYKSFTFSGGEPHIKILSKIEHGECVMVSHRVQSFNDFGLLVLAIDALKRMGAKVEVFVPYFPAARQDRLMVPGEPLSVKVVANILNGMKVESVTVFDPHSEVTPAVLDHCNVVSNHNFVKEVAQRINGPLLLISPDGGALKKVGKLAEYLQDYEVVECSKVRDVKTGKLRDFKVYADDLNGMDCLIVDDICDGGGTFKGIATSLKKKNAGKLYMAVSHAIFSRGVDHLVEDFEQLFITDSFNNGVKHDKVVKINLEDLLM